MSAVHADEHYNGSRHPVCNYVVKSFVFWCLQVHNPKIAVMATGIRSREGVCSSALIALVT